MDFCEALELEYPYAHAIGNIRAIIGADYIKPAEKVKRVQSVLDELNQRVLERCAGGKDMNVPTMPAGQPLTLEQLRGMDGQPVWIMESPDWGHWELSEDAEDYLEGRDTSLYGITYPDHDCKGGVHQLRWIAYAYPPAHIDREALTSEWINSMPALGAGDLETRCKSCGSLVLFETDFCPYCGKAMTEEGWAELEKRVRGIAG